MAQALANSGLLVIFAGIKNTLSQSSLISWYD
jgi:hypothetical protein